jgi:hypothetical protein
MTRTARLVVLVGVVSGCTAGGPGSDAFIVAQGDAALEVCSCASALDWDVEECLERFDIAGTGMSAGDAQARACFDEAYRHAAVGGREPDLGCYAEAASELSACARDASTCEEEAIERCVDRYEVTLTRCPGVSADYFNDVQGCMLGFPESPVDAFAQLAAVVAPLFCTCSYVEAGFATVDECMGHQSAYRACVDGVLRPNEAFAAESLRCTNLVVWDYLQCVDRDQTCDGARECLRVLDRQDDCPAMVEPLQGAVASCG